MTGKATKWIKGKSRLLVHMAIGVLLCDMLAAAAPLWGNRQAVTEMISNQIFLPEGAELVSQEKIDLWDHLDVGVSRYLGTNNDLEHEFDYYMQSLARKGWVEYTDMISGYGFLFCSKDYKNILIRVSNLPYWAVDALPEETRIKYLGFYSLDVISRGFDWECAVPSGGFVP